MSESTTLDTFATDLQQEIIATADDGTEESFRTEAFARVVLDTLVEAGEIDDGEVCYYRSTGMEVHGYAIDPAGEDVDLLVCVHTANVPPETVTKQEVATRLKRLTRFLEESRDGLHRRLEEASPAYDLAERIHEVSSSIARVRLFVATDGLVTREGGQQSVEVANAEASAHIWDIQRLFRCVTSANRREPIEIDVVGRFGRALPCLPAPAVSEDCAVYLAAVPGQMLADLYHEYGTRLLERNVRAFLQARGKVNKGIRDTLLTEPGRFLAYNNGISATAAKIELATEADGTRAIRWLLDLQIVNGGQTTASIHHAAYRDHADVSGVLVPLKLSVIDAGAYANIVPVISRCANTQNKVNDADFLSNEPFHIRIEELSRTVWAPAAPGEQRQSRWYYERARGQYNDERARELTPARKRMFSETHPVSQRFTKTDLAKFENTWQQLPHVVSRGAEKNFREFTSRLSSGRAATLDVRAFQHIVARAILFRTAERLVQAESFGGYRANIVTYSLAWLFHRTAGRVDLDAIWQSQGVSAPLQDAITQISRAVHGSIANPPGGRNVTEWCKREECWQRVQVLEIELPADLEAGLVPAGMEHVGEAVADTVLSPEDLANVERVKTLPGADWKRLATWAKQSGHLHGWQRGIAFSIGQRLMEGRDPSGKQAAQGVKILEEAMRLGFSPQSGS